MKYIPKLQLGDQLNLLRKVSKSNTDFVNRLKQPNRDFIKDWASPNIATHKMSWATDNKGAIIYPQVQNINGKLIDFTRPPYNKWAGLDSAIEKGDTLKTTPEMAQWFTTNYKKFFPKFSKGGKLIPKLQTAWSPLTLTPEKEQAAQKLIQQRALQGYNTSGVNWLKETPEITSKRKALASKQQTEYQNKRFANRTNEVPINGIPAATQIGLKNVHPEFALMTGGVGSGMTGIKGAVGYGAIQGGLWNSAGIAGEQNLEGLAGDVIGGGIAGGVIKGAGVGGKKIINKISTNKPINGVDYLKNYYSNENFLKRYAELNPEYSGNHLQHEIKNRLNDYIPKTYKDLYKDTIKKNNISDNLAFLSTKIKTGGLSYGTPDGIYLNSTMNKFSLTPIKTNESVRVHELTHLLENNGKYLTDADKKLLQSSFIPKKEFNVLDKIKNKIFLRDYMITPTEIHARINQARYELNLKPGDVFTEKMYNNLNNPLSNFFKNSFNGMGRFIQDKNKFIDTMNKMWGVVPAVTTGYGLTQNKKE